MNGFKCVKAKAKDDALAWKTIQLGFFIVLIEMAMNKNEYYSLKGKVEVVLQGKFLKLFSFTNDSVGNEAFAMSGQLRDTCDEKTSIDIDWTEQWVRGHYIYSRAVRNIQMRNNNGIVCHDCRRACCVMHLWNSYHVNILCA